jgi:AraC-like DNA-binding protein
MHYYAPKNSAICINHGQPDMVVTTELPLRQMPQAYYERDAAIIPSSYWPAALIDLAITRAIPEHKLLRHTGIFCEDFFHTDHRICPEQLLQLIHNIQKNYTAHDISFLLGHQLLPSNMANLNQQLVTARNLIELIDALIEHQHIACPLINIRCTYEGDQLVICWQDSCGAEDAFTFLVETMTTAICSMTRWRSNTRLPWTLYFAHKKPEYIEQYQVHLGGDLYFDCQRNAMSIARDYCYQAWTTIHTTHTDNMLPHPLNIPSKGFLTEVYDYLNNNISTAPNLEKTAADFGMSCASFKRKLKKHRSHFQAIYDAVRKDLAVYWIHKEGWSSEQVAQRLHFHDVANLRRAFKKWTGLTLLAARR